MSALKQYPFILGILLILYYHLLKKVLRLNVNSVRKISNHLEDIFGVVHHVLQLRNIKC